MILMIIITVAGGLLLAWVLDREAKRRARALAWERFLASPEYSKLRDDFERFSTAVGEAMLPVFEKLAEGIARALDELDPVMKSLNEFAQDPEERDL
jgi:hypothetical protein